MPLITCLRVSSWTDTAGEDLHSGASPFVSWRVVPLALDGLTLVASRLLLVASGAEVVGVIAVGWTLCNHTAFTKNFTVSHHFVCLPS